MPQSSPRSTLETPNRVASKASGSAYSMPEIYPVYVLWIGSCDAATEPPAEFDTLMTKNKQEC